MDIPLLKDIVIIFGLSTGVLFLFSRLRIPTILGFLLTGTLAGPHAFGLISAAYDWNRVFSDKSFADKTGCFVRRALTGFIDYNSVFSGL